MEHEPIYLDGVDVSECVSFDKLNGQNICCYEDTREDKIPFANFCVENKDCYFKQLQRKTQECEELKDARFNLNCEIYSLNRYRKALEPFQDEYFKGLDTTVIAELAKKSIRLTKENRNLETALEDIEEVIKSPCAEDCVYYESSRCYDCIKTSILDIINKVKGEECN